uniref:Uncharacterized protein n=1 Tax=Psilocybe cubensis TaxID=181762 RepID=A0A8H7XVW6_PSICU
MIVESAAVYTILLIFNAIIGLLPSFNNLGARFCEVEYYVGIMLVVAAGLSPTILVARIALNDSNSTACSLSATSVHMLQLRQNTLTDGAFNDGKTNR